jgi:hypothetical protein
MAYHATARVWCYETDFDDASYHDITSSEVGEVTKYVQTLLCVEQEEGEAGSFSGAAVAAAAIEEERAAAAEEERAAAEAARAASLLALKEEQERLRGEYARMKVGFITGNPFIISSPPSLTPPLVTPPPPPLSLCLSPHPSLSVCVCVCVCACMCVCVCVCVRVCCPRKREGEF